MVLSAVHLIRQSTYPDLQYLRVTTKIVRWERSNHREKILFPSDMGIFHSDLHQTIKSPEWREQEKEREKKRERERERFAKCCANHYWWYLPRFSDICQWDLCCWRKLWVNGNLEAFNQRLRIMVFIALKKKKKKCNLCRNLKILV